MSRIISRSLSCPQLLAQQGRTKASIHTLVIAEGQDEKELRGCLQPLTRDAGGRWSVTTNGKGIHAGFQFKTFKKAWVSGFFAFSYSLDTHPFMCVSDY